MSDFLNQFIAPSWGNTLSTNIWFSPFVGASPDGTGFVVGFDVPGHEFCLWQSWPLTLFQLLVCLYFLVLFGTWTRHFLKSHKLMWVTK